MTKNIDLTKIPIEYKNQIDAMDRITMARLWRFAEVGNPLFQEVGDYFVHRFFKILGGFTPEISKLIGWDK